VVFSLVERGIELPGREVELSGLGQLVQADVLSPVPLAKVARVDNRRSGTKSTSASTRSKISRDRVLPQASAPTGAAEEKSAPETLTTACHAASWLVRS